MDTNNHSSNTHNTDAADRPSEQLTPDGPYDLRPLFRAIGGFSGERALAQAPPQRTEADLDVEMLDTSPAELLTEPLRVAGFVDGIQNALTVTYRSHRPVYLTYAAAGAVTGDGTPLRIHERLRLLGSSTDTDWVAELGSELPFTGLGEPRPDQLARAAAAVLRSQRDALEQRVVEELTAEGAGTLVIDGALIGRPELDQLVGVVKTTNRRYLADESTLWGLPAGWRSPRFKLPSGSQGVDRERYSCYVRLHDATQHAWDYALIRLETYHPALLEPLGALALAERQSARAKDQRYDRHLAGVRLVEQTLRARRPDIYQL